MFAKSQINIDLVTTEAFCLIPLPKQKKNNNNVLKFPFCSFLHIKI